MTGARAGTLEAAAQRARTSASSWSCGTARSCSTCGTDFTGRCCRRVAVSRDGGASFDDLGHQEALPEPLPAGCQASVLAVPGGPLLFSCPADPGGQRCDLQVRGSWDEGQSWPTAVRIHGSLAAYSCLELLRAAGGGAAE
eukprot:CAMPEP_0175520914 /NCGR_PEP_ID=MMETSP0096-20121207/16754_1 /TAXON_ID=311494 /ORGANISM="Alexandrium monilatum, Strain CCMP3105" /LENGTH=140 /DNA_ID=CAMNT_0016823345 /DNA_START=68 /DNA_END=487 /DNA_ORIENTATION=+